MSRGPGRIERIVEQTLVNAEQSYTIEELAFIAYSDINQVDKKHRVAVLRALANVQERSPLWWFQTFTPPWRWIITNRNSVRSYAHGLLRSSWWLAPDYSLNKVEKILADPAVQSVMEPGGLWWIEVEMNKTDNECDERVKQLGLRFDLGVPTHLIPPDLQALYDEFHDLRMYRDDLASNEYLHRLLGRFEPPGTPAFQYAMEHPI
jgi:hypothetical protein